MITIERAGMDDLREVIELQRLAFRKEALRTDDWKIPPMTQTVEELAAESPTLTLLVARENGRIIGSGRAKRESDSVHLGRFAVHPEFQGRGIGTSIIRALEAAYPDATRFELFTSSVSDDNIRLYSRLGYVEFARKVLSDKVTLVFMEKRP